MLRSISQLDLDSGVLVNDLDWGAIAAAEKFGNSLDWVPANVAFYSASLRMKEQIDIVAASNAWKQFRAIPSVEMVWNMVEGQVNDPNGPAAIPLQFMEFPENQQLLQMLGEMFSQEIVFYGGPKVGDCLELFQLVNAAQQQAHFKLLVPLGSAIVMKPNRTRHVQF